jgi:hypothetical protein
MLPPLKLTPRSQAATELELCPYCRELLSSEESLDCDRCATALHSCCWLESRRCTTHGCDGRAALLSSGLTAETARAQILEANKRPAELARNIERLAAAGVPLERLREAFEGSPDPRARASLLGVRACARDREALSELLCLADPRQEGPATELRVEALRALALQRGLDADRLEVALVAHGEPALRRRASELLERVEFEDLLTILEHVDRGTVSWERGVDALTACLGPLSGDGREQRVQLFDATRHDASAYGSALIEAALARAATLEQPPRPSLSRTEELRSRLALACTVGFVSSALPLLGATQATGALKGFLASTGSGLASLSCLAVSGLWFHLRQLENHYQEDFDRHESQRELLRHDERGQRALCTPESPPQ